MWQTKIIDKVIKNQKKNDKLNDKLSDLKLIFNEFKKNLSEKKLFIKEDKYNLLDEKILDVDMFNERRIIPMTFETALNQRFYTHLTCTNPTDTLILSYIRLDSNNECDEKSSLVTSIENLYLTYETIDDNKIITTSLKTQNVNKENFKFYNTYSLLNFISENIQNIRKSYIRDKDGNLKYVLDEKDRINVLKKGNVLFY